MHHNPPRPFALLVCLGVVTCASLVKGLAEDGVSVSASSEWSAPPSAPRQLGSPASWGHGGSDPLAPLLARPPHLTPPMSLHTIAEAPSRPLRIVSPGVPKRLYFAPRLGKRSSTLVEGQDARGRWDATPFAEEPEEVVSAPYRWWWPLAAVRRSSFSPRPGKREEMDLPYDLAEDLYEAEDEDEDEGEDEDIDTPTTSFQDKRGSGFAFSPRLGKRGGSTFAFGPRPGKKSSFAFGPRPGKKANFAFGPRPGKRTSFAFAPRPGKKDTFAFAPRPGKKTSFAFSPRLGKKAGFAFAPRQGKRDSSSDAGDRQDGEGWWLREADGVTVTTLPPFQLE